MRCVVCEIIPETSDTQTYQLTPYLPFKAGQAVSLLIPGDPKKRFYSVSSSPSEKDHISITIKSGDKERKLFDSLFKLNKGTEVEISGPMGSFTLPEKLEGPFYFLAAGSGVTPFRSMVKFLIDTRPEIQTWLFHSVRTPDDLLFKEDFLKWSDFPAFHYVPTFTRYNDSDHVQETGRIGQTLLKKHLPIMVGTFFLCGPREFVKDMEHVLAGFSVPPERIRRDQW
jgi:NADH oxidoreductase Hcr